MTDTSSYPDTEGIVVWRGLRTWFRVIGDLQQKGAMAPVVLCHGGPGLTHDYLLPAAELARSGRPCVWYDQFGNGRSGHWRDAPPDFWTVELFIRELQTLVEHLGIADAFHLVGHSWGGMLALELAVRRPPGLRSIVVADAFASSATYATEVSGLVGALPETIRVAIERHESAGTTDSPEYQEAMRTFYGRHVCRVKPVPDEVRRTLVALHEDSTVYETMMGSSEFSFTGTLSNWDITSRSSSIEIPVLLISGRYDEVTPRAVEELWRSLPTAEWLLFDDSSHMPHIEEHDRFIDVVERFLEKTDSPPG